MLKQDIQNNQINMYSCDKNTMQKVAITFSL